jgi:hypothetical protein
MRQAARIDTNQAAIVAALRAQGASVYLIKLPVDLLVGYGGKTALVEVKNPASRYGRAGLNTNQQDWLASWKGGPAAIVDSVDAAQRLLAVMGHWQ